VEIVTPRLILREFTPEDLPALLAHHADPRLHEFYGPEDLGEDLARDLVARFIRWAAESPRRNYQLAIARREDSSTSIGSCGVRLEGCEAGMAELGLQLAPDQWGRGFAAEAARAILNFGLHDLNLQEIHGVTVTENTRVQRLVDKLGFTRVETRPGPGWMRDRGWSETVWKINAERWPS
jgi:[ribosomal protein S5]-alanine N-acetyltransferase